MRVLQNVPLLDGREREYVLDCLETNWISSQGAYITRFEEQFASYCGARFGVACSSGTTAIQLALEALGIGKGDEVIVPDYTLVADSNMTMLAGARPVFADVDPLHWCIDPAQLEKHITKNTKAILCVHMYGHPCPMDELRAIAAKHRLLLIEDAAQAHGSEYRGRKCGALGDISCFSFYATKLLTTGEGGMVLTNDEGAAERLRLLRNHGFEGQRRNYIHGTIGYNYRLTNLQAAIGLAQVEKIDEKVSRKIRIFDLYASLLEGIEGIELQTIAPWAKSTFWNMAVLVNDRFGIPRDEVMKRLEARGVHTSTGFRSLHAQPVYAVKKDETYPDTSGRFPVTDRLSNGIICLPSSLSLQEEEIRYVVRSLSECRS